MKIYNLLKPKGNTKEYNFNLIPYISFFWSKNYFFLNIGWLHITLQFNLHNLFNSKK